VDEESHFFDRDWMGHFVIFYFEPIEFKSLSNLFQQGDLGGNVSMALCYNNFDTKISSAV
jgi:hypothetical protein